MKTISKADALKIRQELLNSGNAGRGVTISRFDRGKYKWTGRASDYIGRDAPDIKGVHAVYVERRSDADGPYGAVMCVSDAH